jgi:hypothetical protein
LKKKVTCRPRNEGSHTRRIPMSAIPDVSYSGIESFD